MSALAVLLLVLAPVPCEYRTEQPMTEFGLDRSWAMPDRYLVDCHEFVVKEEGLIVVEEFPDMRWRYSGRKLRMSWLPFYDVKEKLFWVAFCDDPACPKCSPSIYQRRR